MIKAKMFNVEFRGSKLMLMAEIVAILSGFVEMVTKEEGAESAQKDLEMIITLGKMTDEEERKENEKLLEKLGEDKKIIEEIARDIIKDSLKDSLHDDFNDLLNKAFNEALKK